VEFSCIAVFDCFLLTSLANCFLEDRIIDHWTTTSARFILLPGPSIDGSKFFFHQTKLFVAATVSGEQVYFVSLPRYRWVFDVEQLWWEVLLRQFPKNYQTIIKLVG
jgi:hypothetical protein